MVHMRNGELHGEKGDRITLHTIRRWKANLIDHFLRKNCLLRHVIEGKIEEGTEVFERVGRRCKQLLDDCKNLEDTER
jgi:hypothetical protein